MVVRCPTQQLIRSGKSIAFCKNVKLRKRDFIYNFGELHEKLVAYNNRPNVRLCVFRCFHSSREPRTTLGKLSPQEVRSYLTGKYEFFERLNLTHTYFK